MRNAKAQTLIQELYGLVQRLEELYPGRHFTPDGHLVGSIGECLVAEAYDLELMPASNPGYDALTSNGKKVEIKATQSTRVGFRSCPEHTIVISISKDGKIHESYNGPGEIVWKEFEGKPLPSNGQYQISLSKLKTLQEEVPERHRIEREA